MKAMLIKTPTGLRGATPADQAREVREMLDYDPATGRLTWKADRFCWNGRRRHVAAGQEAGFISTQTGYRMVSVFNRPYMAHRLAWLHMTGDWPAADIDHMNGDRADNCWHNLRDVRRQVNLQNIRAAKGHKKHGTLLGTAWHAKTQRWRALIKVDGKQKSLGYFPTEAEAHAAYVEGKRRLHEGCTI